MRNSPERRRGSVVLLATVTLLAVVAGLVYATPGKSTPDSTARLHADSVGTLQVNSSFTVNFSPTPCPAGTPATTACHPQVSVGPAVFPGLGNVTTTYTLMLENLFSACTRVHGQIPLIVSGKGEIDLEMPSSGCISPTQLVGNWPAIEVAVSGGSGRYAGASGSGVMHVIDKVVCCETGRAIYTWTGTLNVAGLTFDLTPPQIAGATSKVVKTRSAKGVRVRYTARAVDATDGPVPMTCAPKSGSVFRVGRTSVACTSADSSGNTAAARFVIAVKRVRR